MLLVTTVSGKRWIVCHNPHEAERDAAQRDAALERISTELERIRDHLVSEVDRLRAAVIDDAGHDFNVNSTKQLREVLFDDHSGVSVSAPETRTLSPDEMGRRCSLVVVVGGADLGRYLRDPLRRWRSWRCPSSR